MLDFLTNYSVINLEVNTSYTSPCQKRDYSDSILEGAQEKTNKWSAAKPCQLFFRLKKSYYTHRTLTQVEITNVGQRNA